MTQIWIVIANHARMRILTSKGNSLCDINSHINPEAHPRGLDRKASLPGPNFDVSGGAQEMDEPVGVTEDEAENFAKAIGKELELERTKHTFEKLYLIAPPAFLGLLRKNLSKPLIALVAEEITKDLIWSKPDEIRTYLPEVL